jgi:hypothetical protein
LTFQMRVNSTSPSGTFHFRLTATPEPTSLILGAIGLSIAGGVGTYVKRRRSKAAATPDSPASAA